MSGNEWATNGLGGDAILGSEWAKLKPPGILTRESPWTAEIPCVNSSSGENQEGLRWRKVTFHLQFSTTLLHFPWDLSL